ARRGRRDHGHQRRGGAPRWALQRPRGRGGRRPSIRRLLARRDSGRRETPWRERMSGGHRSRDFHAHRPGSGRALVRGSLVAWLGASLLVSLAGCTGSSLEPVAIDTKNDTCAWCRMAISDTRFAAELLAPAEEPRLFDDIGCLRDYLAASASRIP